MSGATDIRHLEGAAPRIMVADGSRLVRKLIVDVLKAQLPGADCVLYVVPRLGTLSPWSSKATDIARVCGLAGVRRIERGRAYLIGGVDRLDAAAHASAVCWTVRPGPAPKSRTPARRSKNSSCGVGSTGPSGDSAASTCRR